VTTSCKKSNWFRRSRGFLLLSSTNKQNGGTGFFRLQTPASDGSLCKWMERPVLRTIWDAEKFFRSWARAWLRQYCLFAQGKCLGREPSNRVCRFEMVRTRVATRYPCHSVEDF
jgi:hypothetical protein